MAGQSIQTGRRYTTGDLARITGVPQQTLISWDRSGVLRASSRPGHRSDTRAPRRYDESALVAAQFAFSVSRMGFKGKEFKHMVALVQQGDRRALKRARIFSYTSGIPGLMTHVFSPDGSTDDRRWIDHLRAEGLLVGEPATLWEIRSKLASELPGLLRIRGEGALGTTGG